MRVNSDHISLDFVKRGLVNAEGVRLAEKATI